MKLPPARKAHDKHVGDLDVFLGLVKKRPGLKGFGFRGRLSGGCEEVVGLRGLAFKLATWGFSRGLL